jgi:hypothetical protein
MAARSTTRRLSQTSNNDSTIQELQRQLAELQERMNDKNGEIEKNNVDTNRINVEDYIEIISLYPGSLTMTTESKGRGLKFTWPKFGSILSIPYSNLQQIMINHSSGMYTDFIAEGYVYINNPIVVKKSGLQSVYRQILNKEQMEEVIRCKSDNAVRLFKSTNRTQQGHLVRMLISKMAEDEKLDLNIIDQFSRIFGINIVDEASVAKSYLGMDLKNGVHQNEVSQ